MSLFNNKYYKVGNPQKLVIFIHGYNGSPEAIDYAVQGLLTKLHDAVVVVPRAPFACEKNKENLQWLSFYCVDPEERFRNPSTSTEEIFEIFNQVGDSFSEMAAKMNAFVDEQQSLWKIDDAHTYIMGFSQGSMMAMYTSLTRKNKVGGCIVVAGLIPGRDRLEKEITSRPKMLILHGKQDATVQYKTLPTTLKWLQAHQILFEKYEFDDLAHRMNDAEMEQAAAFINC